MKIMISKKESPMFFVGSILSDFIHLDFFVGVSREIPHVEPLNQGTSSPLSRRGVLVQPFDGMCPDLGSKSNRFQDLLHL